MAQGAKALYSQGFNFATFVEKGVDARTGQYTSSIALYQSPAKARNCVAFNLSLHYSPLTIGDIGFGPGWSLNLSQFQHTAPRILSLASGEHYRVTDAGAVRVIDQRLQHFKFQQKGSDYEIIHKDGRIEVLSHAHSRYNTCVPVALYAANGRALTLDWTVHEGQPRLSKIQDGKDVLLQINYRHPRVEIVHAPGTTEAATFTIYQYSGRLSEFRLPLEGSPKWTFTYETHGTVQCISQVRAPNGHVEKIQYKAQGHKLPSDGPFQYIPYATVHTSTPGNQQPPIRTLYSYSPENFLGYGAVAKWKKDEDNLYRVTSPYKYTSTVSIDGGRKTTSTYNRFHLLVKTEHQLDRKETTQVITYHLKDNVVIEYQPEQFQLPKRVETTYRDAAAPSKPIRKEVTEHEFDKWGNPTMDIQTDGIRTERLYYPPDGEQGKCPADPHGFQRYLKEEIMTPPPKPDAAPVRAVRHTYQSLRTATGAPASSFILPQQSHSFQEGQAVSSIERVYYVKPDERDHGRRQKQTAKLFDDSPMVKSWAYRYSDAGTVTETRTLQTFDGFTEQEETDYSLHRGLVMRHTDKAGIVSQFEYDSVGRQTVATTAPGTTYEATTKHDYEFASKTAGDILTATDVKKVKTRYKTDGLGRICEVERQDDDGTWDSEGSYTGTFRLVKQNIYNAQGQCRQTNEFDWLKSETAGEPEKQVSTRDYQYDGWGHVSKTTDSNGVVTLTQADPTVQTYTQGIENLGKIRTTRDEHNVLIQTAMLESDGTVYSTIDYVNDGLGRKAHETDSLGATTRYKYEWFDRVSQTTFPDGRIIKTEFPKHSAGPQPESIQVGDVLVGKEASDGLDRVKSSHVGSRATTMSYTGIQPKPSLVTTPKKDELQMGYDKTLGYALTTLTSSDNSETFVYDHKTGEVLQSKNTYCTEEATYLPSGRLETETFRMSKRPASSTAYTYSTNGRLLSYENIHGQTQTIRYDAHGRLKELSQGHVTVTLSYDVASRLSQTIVKDTQKGSTLTTDIKYDDFGREILRTISQGQTLLYSLDQKYDVAGLLRVRELKGSNDSLLRKETFEYDKVKRLADYQCQGEQAPVDHGGRQIKHQQYSFTATGGLKQVTTLFQDGSKNIADHTYSDSDPSQLVRITNTHPGMPKTIVLEYDDNGNLTRDERGRKLQYDAKGFLKTVRDADGTTVLSEYHHDAEGKLVCQSVPGKPDHYLNYRGDKLIAAVNGDTQVSYLSDGHEYWGQILQESGQGQHATTQLWASDGHQSTVAWLDTSSAKVVHSQSYTPYGFCATTPAVGWDGEWRDPVTGWYHLGRDGRVYNPVLMLFHSPDSWCPFISGEINPYTYCLGDPINRLDPSGHFSILGRKITWKDVVEQIAELALNILAAIFTDGISAAVEAGVEIEVGVASSVAAKSVPTAVLDTAPALGSSAAKSSAQTLGSAVGEGISLQQRTVSVARRTEELLLGARNERGAAAAAAPRLALEDLTDRNVSLDTMQKKFNNAWRNYVESSPKKKLKGSAPHEFKPFPNAKAGTVERNLTDYYQQLEEVARGANPSTRWTLDDAAPNIVRELTANSRQTLDEFKFFIRERGFSPTVAAGKIVNSMMESYDTGFQYQIRLGGSQRLSFLADQNTRTVRLLEAGAHTKAKK